MRFIDEIFAFTGTVHTAGYRNFTKVEGQKGVIVVKRQRYFSNSERTPKCRTGKNDIFHFGAAQIPYALFTQSPPYRIRNITFPTAVRADNGIDSRAELKFGLVGKRFEPKDLELFQKQTITSSP